ncbi:MAG: spore gernimation protein [Firmicutes bacterium HGW-Firmicutes-1]|jgi:spore germination protein KB|nr:MAG: spore gernimation protein [Firmicutes bacterium HGW-Firmicutes-1]
MTTVNINKWQLYCLMMLFEIGSTTVFGLGIDAKQDAWIAILVAMLFGFVLVLIYSEIQNHYRDKDFAEIISTVFSKWLSIPLILIYALEFFWVSTLNFREFGELVSMILLPATPLWVILTVFMLTSIYILFLGVEVLARMGEIMFPIVIFFILSIIVFSIISGEVDLTRLQPVLGSGPMPVFKAAVPAVVNFPFGEMVVFLMYWKYINDKKAVRKVALYVSLTIGLLLSSILALMVAVLDVAYVVGSTIPIYEVIKLINIADIITNLDAIATVVMFIGGFFKMTIHFFGGVLAIKALFNARNDKGIIIISGIIWTVFSLTYYPNLIFHRWAGLKLSITYFYSGFTVLEIVCPLLILVAILLKTKIQEKKMVEG